MNIGIIGLPQTGKKTVFELLVGSDAPQRVDASKTLRGVADAQDDRLEKLIKIYTPKKVTRARIDLLLPPRIEERAVSQGDIFRDLSEVEAFCHVVRCFEDDSIYHMSGSVDPARDINFVNDEFILHDLMFVEKRLERLAKDLMKRPDKSGEREKEALLKLKTPLESEHPLRTVELTDEEDLILRSYPLLSRRKMIVGLNVSDDAIGDTKLLDELRARFAADQLELVQVSAKVESEIAALDTEAEQREFMDEVGISDTALHVLTRECIRSLGLMSFFTAGPSEVRQWFVRRGASAVEAAGKIHSDLARGFIRAEVISYADLIEYGSEEKVKASGKLAVKGRDYVVEDGDILFIRFNV